MRSEPLNFHSDNFAESATFLIYTSSIVVLGQRRVIPVVSPDAPAQSQYFLDPFLVSNVEFMRRTFDTLTSGVRFYTELLMQNDDTMTLRYYSGGGTKRFRWSEKDLNVEVMAGYHRSITDITYVVCHFVDDNEPKRDIGVRVLCGVRDPLLSEFYKAKETIKQMRNAIAHQNHVNNPWPTSTDVERCLDM